MGETQYTPGPWYVGAMNDALFIIDKPPRPSNDDVNPDRDVKVICCRFGASPEGDANANLVAAAPDLLAALRGVLRVADRKTDEFDAARAAIAKAEGHS